MTTRPIARSVVLALLWSVPLLGPAAAQTQHSQQHLPRLVLEEGGQGGFAALAEVVSRLEADPTTDWSRVDVAALREHLVDMNALFLGSVARERTIPGGAEIEVEATGRALAAVQWMVPAHATELTARSGWEATGRATPTGAWLRVTAKHASEAAMIRALGFFGLMTLGQHHRAHHWAIASGNRAHVH